MMRRILTFLVLFGASCLSAEKPPADDPGARPTVEALDIAREVQEALSAQMYPVASEGVEKILKKALPGSYDEAMGNLLKAQIALGQEDFGRAIDPLSRALQTRRLAPDLQERYTQGLAQILYYQSRPLDALTLLENFVATAPEVSATSRKLYTSLLLMNDRNAPALEQAKLLLRLESQPPAEYYQMAIAALQGLGRPVEMLPYLEQLVAMNPDDADVWDQLVAGYFNAGDTWGAIEAFERAQAKGFKTDPKMNLQRAELYYTAEHYEAAARLLEEGLAAQTVPNETAVWDMLIYCYEITRQTEAVRQTVRRAADTLHSSHYFLRLAQFYWAEKDFSRVLSCVRDALKQGEVANADEAWLLAAAAALALEDPDQAAAAIEAARQVSADAQALKRLESSLDKLRRRLALDAASLSPAS